MSSPPSKSPIPPPLTHYPPYTLREALYGTHGLEPCVSHIQHNFPPAVLHRLQRFAPILDRPKQALQHLLELFILHVCRIETPSDSTWHANLLDYLVPVSQHIIPAVQPLHSVQWHAVTRPPNAKPILIPQKEEHYPPTPIPSKLTLDIIRTYSSSFQEPDITPSQLQTMTALMDEPAKSAVMAYAWYLHSLQIKNGWLRPYLSTALGRRERPRNCPGGADGRLDRAREPLHTLYAAPYLDTNGHLVWYTVRHAKLAEIIGLQASSYARGNNVRIHSCMHRERSVRIHHTQICNIERLDYRLWESWTHGARAFGAFAGLGNRALTGRWILFDAPVVVEDALAVGFRVVAGALINPNGRRMVVARRPDGLYTAKVPLRKGAHKEHKAVKVDWHRGMKFA